MKNEQRRTLPENQLYFKHMPRSTSYWLIVPALFLAGVGSVVYLALPVEAPDRPRPTTPVATSFETPLNNHYETLGDDPYCGTAPLDRPWSASTSSAEWEVLDSAWQEQFGLGFDLAEGLVADRPGIRITSWCRSAEELFITAYEPAPTKEGQQLYEILQWGSGEWNELATVELEADFALISLTTQLFEDERLALVARVGDASYAKWFYGDVIWEMATVIPAESCTHWFGGGWSPYGDEEKLVCEVEYKK